jgi:hypothetical protein
LLWTLFSVVGVVGLICFSYQRLMLLRRWVRWAAPYLAARPRAEDAPRLARAELDEATNELRWQLQKPALIPQGCAKVAFWLGAMSALMQASRQLDGGAVRDWIAPVLSLSSGCCGALGCAFIGRAAEAEAQRLREEWNALIRRSTRDVAT